MKITDIKLTILEVPDTPGRTWKLVQVPGLRRTQYTHAAVDTDEPAHEMILRVLTDEGVEGWCTGGTEEMVELLRLNVIGEDPFDRERLFQKLHTGTRWVYLRPAWFGAFDNCLWDIAGKVAGLPIYKLIGRVRDGLPAYLTGDDGPVEQYIRDIEGEGLGLGIRAYKPHSYKGGKADIPIMRKLREHVGPDYALLLDPVCSYTLREAIEVGHVLEELDFVWLEEPFHEQKLSLYQELCAELTIPVMSTETLMYDMDISAQWLIAGATDRLRTNARLGTTQVLKLAHFAELYNTNIEMNGTGGLYGLVHAHLGCCIANTDFYEYFVGGGQHNVGPEVGMMNPPQIVDGHLSPPDGPGWGAEWDMALFKKRTVAEV
jgi:L-alanine-DL-glutamate epimerase-like enolase superfamily enzyme